MKILMAKDQLPVQQAGGYKKFVEQQANARVMLVGLQKINWETNGTVYAEVHRSSWRAGCPICGSGWVVELGQPFWCADCGMRGSGYALEVIFPENREQIEQALLKRPDWMTRNWLAGETLEDLLEENERHGL